MKTGQGRSKCDERHTAAEALEQFIGLFESKGWLNRFVVIKSGDARYRLFCSESAFLVYRMNESWGVSPGVPGWPVCMVTRDRLFHDGSTCAFATEEPETREWLRLLAENDFEVTRSI